MVINGIDSKNDRQLREEIKKILAQNRMITPQISCSKKMLDMLDKAFEDDFLRYIWRNNKNRTDDTNIR